MFVLSWLAGAAAQHTAAESSPFFHILNLMPTDDNRLFRRIRGRFDAQDIAPLVSLAVLVLFFALATPNGTFLKPSTLAQVFKQGAVLAIVSVGLT